MESEGVPHKNVPFLSTTSNKSALLRVNERIDRFLMNIECFVVLVLKFIDFMDMDETVDRRRNYILEVVIIFDLGDPRFMDDPLHVGNTLNNFLVFYNFLLWAL